MNDKLKESLFVIKIGGMVLDEFHKEMAKKKYAYKDFQRLQDDYEKILDTEVKKGIAQGRRNAIEEIKKTAIYSLLSHSDLRDYDKWAKNEEYFKINELIKKRIISLISKDKLTKKSSEEK